MAIGAAVETAGSVLDIVARIIDLIDRADRSTALERRVLLYLDAAQGAVEGLRAERQGILRDARLCRVADPDAIAALHERLVSYLQVDRIRPELEKALAGLRGCNDALDNAARVRWRPRLSENRVAALAEMKAVLAELDDLLQRQLVYDGLLPYSGMMVSTLLPILDLVERLRNEGTDSADAAQAELAVLVLAALDDPSERDWNALTGRVETMKAKIALAFDVEALHER